MGWILQKNLQEELVEWIFPTFSFPCQPAACAKNPVRSWKNLTKKVHLSMGATAMRRNNFLPSLLLEAFFCEGVQRAILLNSC